jgi:hypothetical protein
MRRKRPSDVLIIAVLHLIGGSLGLLAVGYWGTVQLVRAAQSDTTLTRNLDASIDDHLGSEIPAYPVIKWGSFAVRLLLCVMLLVAGFGLIWMRSWARQLSLSYAALSILYHLFDAVASFGWIIPATTTLVDWLGPNLGESEAYLSGMKVTVYTLALLNAALIAYPILVLWALLRRSTADAFADEEEWEDRHDEDRPRSRRTGHEPEDRYP